MRAVTGQESDLASILNDENNCEAIRQMLFHSTKASLAKRLLALSGDTVRKIRRSLVLLV